MINYVVLRRRAIAPVLLFLIRIVLMPPNVTWFRSMGCPATLITAPKLDALYSGKIDSR